MSVPVHATVAPGQASPSGKPIAPRHAFLRIAISGVLLSALCYACGVVILGPLGHGSGVLRWVALSFGAAALFVAALTVRRAAPLYRAFLRSHEGGEGAPPPSPAAIRDAFEAPALSARGVGLVLAVSSLLSVLVLADAGATARSRLFVLLVVLGLFAPALSIHAWACRSALRGWTDFLTPEELPGATRGGPRILMTLAFALPAASAGTVMTGVLLEGSRAGAWYGVAIVFALSVAVTALLAYFGGRLGRLVEGDLGKLDSQMKSLLQDREVLVSDAERVGGTVETHALSQALDRLARRYWVTMGEQAKAREAIDRARRMKSRFMAFMSHDLKSPLNSIRGFAEVLAQGTDGPLNPQQRESVEMIAESGEELMRLVENILDAAKLEAGRLSLHLAWTASVEILTEAVAEGRRIIGDAPIELVTFMDAGLPPVRADRGRVVQAMVAVLTHLIRAMDGGAIEVRARVARRGESAELRVDMIAPSAAVEAEDLEGLFGTFESLHRASGRRIGGLGLGLSLARGLMEQHGGRLGYEVVEGATAFCMALPCEE